MDSCVPMRCRTRIQGQMENCLKTVLQCKNKWTYPQTTKPPTYWITNTNTAKYEPVAKTITSYLIVHGNQTATSLDLTSTLQCTQTHEWHSSQHRMLNCHTCICHIFATLGRFFLFCVESGRKGERIHLQKFLSDRHPHQSSQYHIHEVCLSCFRHFPPETTQSQRGRKQGRRHKYLESSFDCFNISRVAHTHTVVRSLSGLQHLKSVDQIDASPGSGSCCRLLRCRQWRRGSVSPADRPGRGDDPARPSSTAPASSAHERGTLQRWAWHDSPDTPAPCLGCW